MGPPNHSPKLLLKYATFLITFVDFGSKLISPWAYIREPGAGRVKKKATAIQMMKVSDHLERAQILHIFEMLANMPFEKF